MRRRTPRADRKRRISRSSISVSRCRSAVSSSTADASAVPANPMSACAAARRVSTRSAPSASSVILTSSPACKPSRRRNSAGRTKRPRASSRAVPRMRLMWEKDSASHQTIEVGLAGVRTPPGGPTAFPAAVARCTPRDVRGHPGRKKAPLCGAFVTRPERFELPTFGSVDRRSIQLSYGRPRPASPTILASSSSR